jgi:hypothetical protein
VPGPFSLAGEGQLPAVLTAAGFEGVTVEAVGVPLEAPSFEAWWARTTAVAGPVAGLIAQLDPSTKDALEQRVRTAAGPYRAADGLRMPGRAWLASGRRR